MFPKRRTFNVDYVASNMFKVQTCIQNNTHTVKNQMGKKHKYSPMKQNEFCCVDHLFVVSTTYSCVTFENQGMISGSNN